MGELLGIRGFHRPPACGKSRQVFCTIRLEIKEQLLRTKPSSCFFVVRREDNVICYRGLSMAGAGADCEFWRQLPSECGTYERRGDRSHLPRETSGPWEVAGHERGSDL